MAATTAVKAGIISAAAGLVLVVGAFAVTSTMAGAQTPTPDTQQQQTTPTTPGGNQKGPMDGTHNPGDCPGMDGSGTGMRGQRPGNGGTPEDGGTSSGTSFHGLRGGGPRS